LAGLAPDLTSARQDALADEGPIGPMNVEDHLVEIIEAFHSKRFLQTRMSALPALARR
jgi:hypothetical protein